MHLAEAGPPDGRPLLALHGWPQHWWMWRRVAGRLAAHGFRVLCPDIRGQGWSDSPADGDFGKGALAADALALLDALGIGEAAVAGHDWGGWTAFLLARRAPERVSRLLALGIVSPDSRGRGVGLRDAAFAYQPLMAAPGLGPWVARSPRLMAAMMRRATERPGTWAPGELGMYTSVQRRRDVAEASSRLYRSFLTREVRATGRGSGWLPMPVLQMVGDADVVGIRLDRAPAPASPRWGVERVPACGHFIVDELPGLVADRALAFL